MKIAIKCKGLVLESTLKLFLDDFVCDESECDFIISDFDFSSSKPLFLVDTTNSHLKTPFSKEQLLRALEEFYADEKNLHVEKNLEKQIDSLTKEFTCKLIKTIRDYYEK